MKSATHMGAGTFRLMSAIDAKWLQPGQPITLMSGHRVLPVGVISLRED